MTLPLDRLRSLEHAAGTNTVRLTLTNGDAITAEWIDRVIGVKTAYGDLKLPASLVRRLNILPPVKPGLRREGLVALWSAEGNANDNIGGNNGMAHDISYADGPAGQAFVFNGSGASYVRIPASSDLDVGQGSGLTIELWCNPALTNNDVVPLTLVEWNNGSGDLRGIGCHLEFYNAGRILGDIVDPATGIDHFVQSAGGNVVPNRWQQVAMTYDKTTGVLQLYQNGERVADGNIGLWTPSTAFDLYLGVRPAGVFAPIPYRGMLDEIALYRRALSPEEIRADYTATRKDR